MYRLHHLLGRALVVAACSTAVACASSDPSSDPNGSATDDTTATAATVTTQCGLLYYNNGCGSGACPSATVDQLTQVTAHGYPSLSQTLTAADAPYVVDVFASPAATAQGGHSATVGYFDLTIQDAASTNVLTSSEAQVSTANVANQVDIEAGDLRANVAPFTYGGQSYTVLEAYCVLTGSKQPSR